jgi:SAM-dependent methyltransferase
MATTNPPHDVGTLFDTTGAAYEEDFAKYAAQLESIQRLIDNFPPRATVLDIGTGTGRPVCSSLSAAGHEADGLDVSAVVIEIRRRNLTSVKFEKVEINRFEPARGYKYDEITIYVSFPAGNSQDDIRRNSATVHKWWKDGGFFIFATVPINADNLKIAWPGYDIKTNNLIEDEVLDTVKNAHLEVMNLVRARVIPKVAEASMCDEADV